MWRCAAVILAAGEAKRMGTAKPVLPFGRGSMISTVIDTATTAGLDPIVVVTGFHQDAVASEVGESATIAHNPDAASGNMSSLLVGIEAAGPTDAIVVLLADMPGVSVGVIEGLSRGLKDSGRNVGWTEYMTGRAHPIAFRSGSVNSIRDLSGSKTLWPYFDALDPADTYRLAVNTERPIDVNTPDDYTTL